MGIVSALFVILLSFSGLILHHSPALNLDNQFISSSRLLSWYEIEVPPVKIQYRAGQHGVQLIAESIYFDSDRLPGNFPDLKGLVATEFGFVAATSYQLLLLTDAGELIEVLGRVHLVPTGISRIGSNSSGIQRILSNEQRPKVVDIAWKEIERPLHSGPSFPSISVDTFIREDRNLVKPSCALEMATVLEKPGRSHSNTSLITSMTFISQLSVLPNRPRDFYPLGPRTGT